MYGTPRTMTEAIAMRRQAELEDFAAQVRGEGPAFRRRVLGELRVAYRRVKLHAFAIHEAARMIKEGVDPEDALASIGDALDYVIPTPPEEMHDNTAAACESESERELYVRD